MYNMQKQKLEIAYHFWWQISSSNSDMYLQLVLNEMFVL